jgi:hypothetical protein
MTTKRGFVQAAVIAWAPLFQREDDPTRWDIHRAIRAAEAAWELLTQRGHGATEPTGPRQSRDWFAELDATQQAWFTRAFKNFGRRGDSKGGAAESWWKLVHAGEMDQALAEWIAHAARLEAEQQRPADAVRKMMQGWLSERRWESYPRPQAVDRHGNRAQDVDQQRRSRVLELTAMISSNCRLPQSEEITAQSARYRDELRRLGVDPDGPRADTREVAAAEGLDALAANAPPEAREGLRKLVGALGRNRLGVTRAEVVEAGAEAAIHGLPEIVSDDNPTER